MFKILLITTEGCAGCSIMRNSIKQALSLTKKDDIVFEELDVKDIDKKRRNDLRLKDFPTTIFVKDSIILRKEVGTRPYIVVLRWIDVDFK